MTFERWLQIHKQKRKEGDPLRLGQRFRNQYGIINESQFPELWEAAEGQAEERLRQLLVHWQYYPDMPPERS